ncbi:MAG: methyltransferase domain-containing protein [Candidatus Aminicenantes bacterium]|nr:methyltransferase domain-containing protein [Candidatus Aminicenantes bacterium]
MSEWFEDEVFWREVYPYLFPEIRFLGAGEEIEKLLDLIDFKGETVLDLCCGPGRHSVALAQKGFSVTGVDRTALFLEKARALAKKDNAAVEWVLEDIRKFSRPGAFDLIVSLMTSFGYFEDEQENLNVLDMMYRNLKEGGIALFDMVGKECVARHFQATSSTELGDGIIFLERHRIYNDWCRLSSDWIVIENGKAETFTFSHSLYSGREIRELLLAAGFKEVKLFGDLDGGEYGVDSRRLVVAAKK